MEVVLDHMPYLLEMDNYRRVLTENELDNNEKETLSDIVCEILTILHTGTSSLERMPKRTVDKDKIVAVLISLLKENILQEFVNNFHKDRFDIIYNTTKSYIPDLKDKVHLKLN